MQSGRKNDMNRHRQGPLKLTTVELPQPLLDRVRRHCSDRKIPLRTFWTEAVERMVPEECGGAR